jgi:hypothetical protein
MVDAMGAVVSADEEDCGFFGTSISTLIHWALLLITFQVPRQILHF